MARSNLPRGISLPIFQEEELVARLDSASDTIASSRDAIVKYRATIADLEDRVRILEADNNDLRAVDEARCCQHTSGTESLRLWHDEEASWKAANNQVHAETANALRREVAEAKAAAEAARTEADVLLMEAEQHRLENQGLREILAGFGISSLHGVKQEAVVSGANGPADEQHGYSLRSRKRPRRDS